MGPMRFAFCMAGLLAVGGFSAGGGRQDDSVYLEEVEPRFLERLRQLEERREWKEFFEWAEEGRRRYGRRLVRMDKDSWTGLSEHLLRRFAGLPAEALEVYRLEREGRARIEITRAREGGDRRLLEKAVEEFFFTGPVVEALDFLGTLCFEEGAVDEAVVHWNRLLRFHRAAAGVSPAVVAARIAHACAAVGDWGGLDELRRFVEVEGLDGSVMVAGRPQRLREFLSRLGPAAPPVPVSPAPGEPVGAPEIRNEVRLGSFEFSRAAEPTRVSRSRWPGQPSPLPDHHPFFPAWARLRGKEYVLLTDGQMVLAVDPARSRPSSPEAGIYWKFSTRPRSPAPPPGAPPVSRMGMVSPYVGVAVDGERAYVAMSSESLQRDSPELFAGPASVKCLHIPTGKLLWDTDSPSLFDEFRRLSSVSGSGFDFIGKNFVFTSPVLVRSGRVFVGVSTLPPGEQESRVLCLDQATGRPLWCTFLSSIPSTWGHPAMPVIQTGEAQTFLAAGGGTIYAHANQGVVAALDGVRGNLLWLTRYPRVSPPRSLVGLEDRRVHRPAGWPLVWGRFVLILPGDRPDLLVLDRSSGRLLEIPPPKCLGGDFRWKDIRRLVGIRGDDLVVAGSPQSYRILLNEFLRSERGGRPEGARFSATALVASDARTGGFGTFHGDRLYLPVAGSSGSGGALAIYDTTTWKILSLHPWRGGEEGGNLLVAGRFLVAAGARTAIYASAGTLREAFAPWIEMSPPRLEALLEFGDLMRESERWEEAVEAYGRFLTLAEGDPESADRRARVRADLHGIFLRRGEEASRRDPARALKEYERARTFAPSPGAEAEAVRRMVEECEKLGRWREAVDFCQELIEKFSDRLLEGPEEVRVRFWEWGRRRIGKIVSRAPEAAREIERRAAEALREAGENEERLREVMDRFPNSGAAVGAWRRLANLLSRAGRRERLLGLYGEFSFRFGEELDFESFRAMLEALEQLGDRVRWRRELVRFGQRFGDRRMEEGGGETAAEYVRRRLGEAAPAGEARPAGPLRTAAELPRPRGGTGDERIRFLRPAGLEPPGFGESRVLTSTGEGVELWNLKGRPERLWSFRPADQGPEAKGKAGVLGAAFTRGYALATVLEDGVVSIDLESGRPGWRFGGIRGGFRIGDFHALNGLLFLGEVRAEAGPGAGPVRLLGLEDGAGRLLWARDFEVAGEGAQAVRVLGPYWGETVGILLRTSSGWQLLVLSARDGSLIRREVVGLQVQAQACGSEGEVLYLLTSQGDQAQRSLRILPLVGSSGSGRSALEVSLRRYLLPGHQSCRLVAGREWVALLASPTAQAPEYRILVSRAGEGGPPRMISLPEGRTLPAAPLAAIDEGGILYVYVYNLARGGERAGPQRAYLMAFRLEGEFGKVAWEAPAPFTESVETAWIVPAPSRHLVLAMERGRPPGSTEGKPLAVIYDKEAQGYIRGVHDDLSIPRRAGGLGAACPADWWRGRLHLNVAGGIRILAP